MVKLLTKYSPHLFLVLLLLFIHSVEAKRVIQGCSDIHDTGPILVQRSERSLQTIKNPNGFRITFLDPVGSNVEARLLSEMSHMFNIAKFFFSRLLKVTEVNMDTRYVNTRKCGGFVPFTSTYAKVGFDYGKSDLVVSTEIFNTPADSYLAYSGTCQINFWPSYGYIGFNLAHF